MGSSYLEYERKGAKFLVRLDAGDTCRIDRSSLSVAQLSDDPTVSLRHAIVQCVEADRFYLTDLNSRNGTMLNGRPIKVPTLLKSGDVIMIGTYELTFRLEGTETSDLADATDDCNTQLVVSSKLITVLVADIRDYTGLTLRLGEALIGETLGKLFNEAGRVLSANHCWGQKYIGDAIMGVWLHESQIPTSEEFQLVFRSLAEIKQVFSTINETLDLSEPIKFGAGINTGYAVIGNMGSRQTPDYTALGDSVNKAFRLESATRGLNADIVLGCLTYELLTPVMPIQTGFTRKVVHLKGYREPEEAFVTDFATVQRILESFAASERNSGVALA